MHSKILNLNYRDEKDLLNKTATKYINYVSNLAKVEPMNHIWDEFGVRVNITQLTELPNYPISNITNSYHIDKESKVSYYTTTTEFAGFHQNISGISITPFFYGPKESDQNTFNCIALQFNKFNKSYMTYLENNGITIILVDKSNDSLSKRIFFKSVGLADTVTVTTMGGTSIYSSRFNYASFKENGLLIIDESLLFNIFGSENITTANYNIDIYCQNPVANGIINMGISNIFMGNSINFFPEENLNYTNNNLNVVSFNKRTGRTFGENNESLKNLSFSLGNLYSQEIIDDLANWIKLNKNSPMLVFPYNHYNSDHSFDAESLKWTKLNYEMGGLFYISKDVKINNSNYDVFNTTLDLIEYK